MKKNLFLLSLAVVTIGIISGVNIPREGKVNKKGQIVQSEGKIFTSIANNPTISVIYDNNPYKKGLTTAWGFSCMIRGTEKNILFDTGTSGSILLSNMQKLNINPASIDEVFISHAHFDHIGGLSDFLQVNKEVTVYIPVSCPEPSGAKEVVSIEQPYQIHENVFSTGELDGIEQSMAIKTNRGILVITGCSHPRMEHILGAASQFGKAYGIIGGLHGFIDFDLFKDLELIIGYYYKSTYICTCINI